MTYAVRKTMIPSAFIKNFCYCVIITQFSQCPLSLIHNNLATTMAHALRNKGRINRSVNLPADRLHCDRSIPTSSPTESSCDNRSITR